jgi:hypothetical protein
LQLCREDDRFREMKREELSPREQAEWDLERAIRLRMLLTRRLGSSEEERANAELDEVSRRIGKGMRDLGEDYIQGLRSHKAGNFISGSDSTPRGVERGRGNGRKRSKT